MATIRETHIATVTDNDDPEKRFRLKAASATLLGMDDNDDPVEFGDWIDPQFQFLDASKSDDQGTCGFFFVPGIGTTIEISVAVQSDYDMAPGQTFLTNPDPRWVSCLLTPGDPVPPEFDAKYPERMGFKDSGGNLFYFDKTEGEERILIRHSKGSFFSMEKDGNITLSTNQSDDTTKKGLLFFLDHDNQGITLLHPAGHFINIYDGGISIVKGGPGGQTMLTITDAGVHMLIPGNFTVQGGVVNLQGGSVLLGGQLAVTPLVLSTIIAELAAEFLLIQTGIVAAGGAYVPTPTFGATAATTIVKGL